MSNRFTEWQLNEHLACGARCPCCKSKISKINIIHEPEAIGAYTVGVYECNACQSTWEQTCKPVDIVIFDDAYSRRTKLK